MDVAVHCWVADVAVHCWVADVAVRCWVADVAVHCWVADVAVHCWVADVAVHCWVAEYQRPKETRLQVRRPPPPYLALKTGERAKRRSYPRQARQTGIVI